MDTLANELSLKAMTAVGSLIADYDRGLISKAQVASGCRAIFDTVGGLVTPKALDLISQAAKEYQCKGYEVLMVRTPEGLRGTVRQCGGAKVVKFRTEGISSLEHQRNQLDEPDLAARKLSENYVESLLKCPS